MYEKHQSSIGNVDANIMMLVAYLGTGIIASCLSFIPFISIIALAVPIVILVMEKNSEYVKFHALQALILNLLSVIVSFFLTFIFLVVPFLGLIISPIILIISLVIFAVEIFVIVKSWKYTSYKFPLVGDFAERFVGKFQK